MSRSSGAGPPRRLLFAAACLVFSGCVIDIEPRPGWTVEQARRTVLAFEARQYDRDAAARDEPLRIPRSALAVTGTTFHDLHELDLDDGTSALRLREVAFARITGVALEWDPAGALATVLTLGLVGPLWYELQVTLEDDRVLRPFGSGGAENAGVNILPLWLLGARFWWRDERSVWEYAEALEVLRREARVHSVSPPSSSRPSSSRPSSSRPSSREAAAL